MFHANILPLQSHCGISSVGRALASQAEGRGFESRIPLHLPHSLFHNIAQPSPEGAAYNIAQGMSPVYDIPQHPPSPSTRQRRVDGEGKRHIEIGLTPYPMLCRPSRAIHQSSHWLYHLFDEGYLVVRQSIFLI